MNKYNYLLILLSFLFAPWVNAATVSYSSSFDYLHNPGSIETSALDSINIASATRLDYIPIASFSSSLGTLTGVSFELDSTARVSVDFAATDYVPDIGCVYVPITGCVSFIKAEQDTGGSVDVTKTSNVAIVKKKQRRRTTPTSTGSSSYIETIKKGSLLRRTGCSDTTPDLLFYTACTSSTSRGRAFDKTVELSILNIASFIDTVNFFEISSKIYADLRCDNSSSNTSVGFDGDVCSADIRTRLYGSLTVNYTYEEFPLDTDKDGIADSLDVCPNDATNSCLGGSITLPGAPSTSVPEASSVLLMALGLLSLFGTLRRST